LELEKRREKEKKTGINSFVCSLLRFEISIFPLLLLSKNIIANYFEEEKKNFKNWVENNNNNKNASRLFLFFKKSKFQFKLNLKFCVLFRQKREGRGGGEGRVGDFHFFIF
jgi:hypothetical protein